MSCTHCDHAQTDPIWPGYQANCRTCAIRALANGPEFFVAQQTHSLAPAYKACLQKMFGDGWKAAHEEVKAEHKRIQQLKGALK